MVLKQQRLLYFPLRSNYLHIYYIFEPSLVDYWWGMRIDDTSFLWWYKYDVHLSNYGVFFIATLNDYCISITNLTEA
jgi:hypothetical protein